MQVSGDGRQTIGTVDGQHTIFIDHGIGAYLVLLHISLREGAYQCGDAPHICTPAGYVVSNTVHKIVVCHHILQHTQNSNFTVDYYFVDSCRC